MVLLIPSFVYSAGVVLLRTYDNPVLLLRDHVSNQRQPPLSRVAAESAVRILAILSQSRAHRPWERKQRRRQPETKAGGAVAATIKAEMALAFSSVRSVSPLLLAINCLFGQPTLLSLRASSSACLLPYPAAFLLASCLTCHEVSGDAMGDAFTSASSQS